MGGWRLERSLGCGAVLGWLPLECFYKAERVGRARGRLGVLVALVLVVACGELGAMVGSALCWLASRWRVAGVERWR